jgi:hypothetical protein
VWHDGGVPRFVVFTDELLERRLVGQHEQLRDLSREIRMNRPNKLRDRVESVLTCASGTLL